MSWCVSLWVYPVWGLMTVSFSMLGKFSTIISSKIFSYPFFLSSSSGTPIIRLLVHLILSQWSLKLASVLFILFTLLCSSEVISTILSSSSLICSSASDILLLIPPRVFLISVIVLFVSVCLFFNSSRSLLIDSCYIFSILFSRFLRKRQSTPRLLPGKSHGQRSPVGYSPRGRKESDTIERLHFTLMAQKVKNLPIL